MIIWIRKGALSRIHAYCESAYPDEGAGFLLGADGAERVITDLIPSPNAREAGARRDRFLIEAADYLRAEMEAERRHLALVGVFHSHPDHPNRPSDFDREWAQPVFSYLITRVDLGRAIETKSWRLAGDRAGFTEEEIRVAE
jgi:proteasome lid subunit RPN8/RPN11